MAKRSSTSFSTTGKSSRSPSPRRRHRVVQKSMEQQVNELVGIMSRHWAASGSKTLRKGYYEVDHQGEKTMVLPIHDKFIQACGKTKTPEDIFAQQLAIVENINKKPVPPKKKHPRAKSASLARLSQPLSKSTVPRRPSVPPVPTQSKSPSNSTHLISSKSVSGVAAARPKTSLAISHPSFPPLPLPLPLPLSLSVTSALDVHLLPSPRLLLSSSISDSESFSDNRSTISEFQLPKFDSQAILPVDRRFMLHQIPDYTKMTMAEISTAHTSILKHAASS